MTSSSQPAIRNNEAAGRFEIEQDGRVAFAEYRILESGVLFPHTEVPPELEGRGLGSALVKHGMAVAKEQGLLVIPVCTFFAGYIRRHPEMHEQVHPDYRTALGI